jgi:FAD synthetase
MTLELLPPCIEDTDAVLACLGEPSVSRAAEAVESALRLYGPSRVLVSFNGGKDATALLHLARAVFARDCGVAPRCVYWHDSGGFPEVEAFVEETIRRYRLHLVRYDCSFAQGMQDAVERLGVAAVLLGTREADPNGSGAEVFQPSSRGWPAFMRVNPLLRWHYSDVWAFLHGCSLPYCVLYDAGYTSLGVCANTRRNPALLRPDGSYGPAHELERPELERGGRFSSLLI